MMTQQQLQDSLEYIQERTDIDPGLTPDENAAMDQLYQALVQAAKESARSDATRRAVAAAVELARGKVATPKLKAPNKWATVVYQTAVQFIR
ncbi:MAG: hypothetical protein JXR83_04415 [Deltaproteobacteria bacterium]|nr:hypothetical protein [Deltaproteobacteria bacterium]